jgi:kynurenine formamidase
MRIVDLSAPLGEATVMWPGDPAPSAIDVETYEREGSLARRVTLNEHSGTHFDAPNHFAAGAASVADVPIERLVRPLHVIDISRRAATDPDTVLTVADIEAHESAHGRIVEGAAVFLRTGWDERLEDAHAYFGDANDLHFPGFGVDGAAFLVRDRGVVGLGIDTLGIDAGNAPNFPVHATVTLPAGVWHVENLINLDAVPPVGATVVVGVPRLVGGSGFPARVIALLPD